MSTTRRTTDGEFVAPTGPIETVLAELLATTLGVERVSVRAHLFDDLGADSLLLAQFSAQVRTRTTLPSIAIGLLQSTIIFLVIRFWFQIPLNGSPWLLYLGLFTFTGAAAASP